LGKKWEGAKDGIWQPKFLELMAATLTKDKDIVFQEGLADTKYTLIVDVVWIYPGWDVAMMKQPAKVSVNLKIVDSKTEIMLWLKSQVNMLQEINGEAILVMSLELVKDLQNRKIIWKTDIERFKIKIVNSKKKL